MSDQPTNRHILVVDDDDQVRRLLRVILEREGYAVDTAADGSEAVARYDAARHALVITDIVMPDKEGIETIMELRAGNPDLPIIAISGGGRLDPDHYLDWARRFGVRHTFAKPIERAQLLAAVAEIMAAATAV